MNSSSNNATDCPDGYRRYVYRIQVPFKEEFQKRFHPSEPKSVDDLKRDLAELEDQRAKIEDQIKAVKAQLQARL